MTIQKYTRIRSVFCSIIFHNIKRHLTNNGTPSNSKIPFYDLFINTIKSIEFIHKKYKSVFVVTTFLLDVI